MYWKLFWLARKLQSNRTIIAPMHCKLIKKEEHCICVELAIGDLVDLIQFGTEQSFITILWTT